LLSQPTSSSSSFFCFFPCSVTNFIFMPSWTGDGSMECVCMYVCMYVTSLPWLPLLPCSLWGVSWGWRHSWALSTCFFGFYGYQVSVEYSMNILIMACYMTHTCQVNTKLTRKHTKAWQRSRQKHQIMKYVTQ
jgi:hypothetical protein